MNTLIWKRLIGKLYPAPLSSGRRVILIYHAVGTGPQALPLEKFQQQVAWLQEYCEVVPLNTLLSHVNTGKKIQVALTFDDGYECVYRLAAPLLQAAKMPATVYLNTGWIGKNATHRKASDANLGHTAGESFLTWPEVTELANQGWEIGSHGVDHLDLTQQPLEVIQTELVHSKQHIESQLHRTCQHFCYTWGRHHQSLRNTVADVGYQFAVAAHHAPVTDQENRVTLPRLHAANEYTLADFKNIVMGKWDFLRMIHRIKRARYA